MMQMTVCIYIYIKKMYSRQDCASVNRRLKLIEPLKELLKLESRYHLRKSIHLRMVYTYHVLMQIDAKFSQLH